MASKKGILFLAVALVLVATNAFTLLKYSTLNSEFQSLKIAQSAKNLNMRIISFMRLFITKVLKAPNEVSFEDRLQLENAVRDLNDPDIFNKWTDFVNSKSEAEAQETVKNLLDILVNKVVAQ